MIKGFNVWQFNVGMIPNIIDNVGIIVKESTIVSEHACIGAPPAVTIVVAWSIRRDAGKNSQINELLELATNRPPIGN